MTSQVDVAIIGGGLVGLATAYRLLERFPDRRVVVFEKEARVAAHQSGRNSGVLHSGVYYTPGSLKAKTCRAGKRAMEAFCAEEGIDYEICGKVIVAVEPSEVPALERIYRRGQANGVECELIGPERLTEIEPHARGVQAIHVPEAGIVDYPAVAQRLAEIVAVRGGEVRLDVCVTALQSTKRSVVVESTAGAVQARCAVTCAGLWADRLAAANGQALEAQIVPFRGEYFALRPEATKLCQGLIYPVPDESFPFLGVHFTRTVEGGVECGPNAVLAFAREGYRKRDVSGRELWEVLTYRGFQRLAARYWRTGMKEMWRSWSKAAFARALQRLVPAVEAEDLEQAPAGVRAQALRPDGKLVDDFLIEERDQVLHVLNAPSPAATASLVIGETLAGRVAERL